ncbi:unnamed protein product [Rangifer tarandus platyrhynchus]|uniref:Uncharacterized protein n=1 Tax=Rangifer tarandus platyrhynchus TaxID=3082113 RepID=A0ABN8XIY1_RANTA|nr:unnamed protein product [Rangifer tarandus platyrhynchus]
MSRVIALPGLIALSDTIALISVIAMSSVITLYDGGALSLIGGATPFHTAAIRRLWHSRRVTRSPVGISPRQWV